MPAGIFSTESVSRLKGQQPYFVAADRRHKKIVVSIRGTDSLVDVLEDLSTLPVPLSEDGTKEQGGNSIGFFDLKIGPDNVPYIRLRCH